MDISLINSQYFNQVNNPFSAPMTQGLQSGAGFEDLLRRVQDASRPPETDAQTTNKTDSGTPISRNAPIDKSSKLYELCLDLETILIKNLIKGMRNTIQKTLWQETRGVRMRVNSV